MKRATDVLCDCGAPFDEIDTDDGMRAKCSDPDCARVEAWPEHLTGVGGDLR
ncbi:hypothetical protein ACQP0C_41745 (plasmid) [Nocardia sp. CA-129566]|uniref:hypothetical protein n=1 Tax=Nocardia sp. CA-129566 TaxID=3239976 RepID=UPI003D99762D